MQKQLFGEDETRATVNETKILRTTAACVVINEENEDYKRVDNLDAKIEIHVFCRHSEFTMFNEYYYLTHVRQFTLIKNLKTCSHGPPNRRWYFVVQTESLQKLVRQRACFSLLYGSKKDFNTCPKIRALKGKMYGWLSIEILSDPFQRK